MSRETRRIDLLTYAIANPGGITVDDIMAEFHWDHGTANKAIHDLRLWLGDFDTINFPCDPQGPRQRWLYRLVGTLDGVRGWVANRILDAESRIRTIHAMVASIVSATDGRSKAGKKVRTMEVALRHLIENLELIDAEDS